MKIAPEVYESMKSDIRTVVDHYGKDLFRVSKPESLAGVWAALTNVSRDRAYSDSHPFYHNGAWTRVLPYDGRDYCFYYANGCNDDHVATALRNIKRELGL